MLADMRSRDRILKSLEGVFREAYTRAEARDDTATMESLDLEYQREQLRMEVLLDLRDLLATPEPDPDGSPTTSLLDRAEALRRIARLR
ncbi:MAG: hypothetical protein EA350_13195 [Gemmatimonadales bacterium]|nr:MAG: hypothetical protein EA350_13195 [Gemmatimonadales bacterium]